MLLTGVQRAILVVCVFAAAGVGALVHFANDLGYAACVAVGLLILGAILFYHGIVSSETGRSSEDYFGAKAHLAATSTMQSLGSTWVMLGNVLVANMFLAQQFGIWTFWVILTWAWAFFLISLHVPAIRAVLGPRDTLHSFLHRAYGSRAMRLVAAFITVFVGIGVFSVELTAGASLLISILPGGSAQYIVPLLIVLVVVTMAVGIMIGGLRGVITADSSLFPIICVSVLTLLIMTAIPIYAERGSAPFFAAQWVNPALDGTSIFVFLLGIAALQVPLLVGDFGTWQRIKATTPADTDRLVKLAAAQAGWQSFLWGVPVVAGILIAVAAPIGREKAGNLYDSGAPLIEIVRVWIESDSVPPWARGFAMTIALVGLLGIMATTANSYLMVAIEAWVHDFRPVDPDDDSMVEDSTPSDVRTARALCVMLALVGCIPIALIILTGLRLLDIVLTVFAVQVALAPAAILALYFPNISASLATITIASTLTAFFSAISLGVFVLYGPATPWFVAYGAYFAPVVALIIPTVAIGGALARREGIGAARRFVANLTIRC